MTGQIQPTLFNRQSVTNKQSLNYNRGHFLFTSSDTFSSDVKRGQNLEAETEAETEARALRSRPRPTFEVEDKA